MKVAYFIGSLNRGGTEMLLLDSFRRRDIAPYESILIYRNEGELSDAYRDTGVTMFRVKHNYSKTRYVQEIRKLLKKENVDVLHTQTLLNAFLGLFCTCFTRVKLVATFHGFFLSTKERFYTYLVLWFANASVFVSGYERDWYVNRTFLAPRKKFHVVYNGIDFSKMDKQYEMPDFLKEKDSGFHRKIKLAMVGNFVSGRSQSIICKSLNALKGSGYTNFVFYFIGKRSEKEAARYDNCVRYVEENKLTSFIHFLGGRGDVPAILQNIDGFVYSTDHDTFGIAVVEAMSMGLPVVVNDWGVMKEITNNGENAILYKTGNVEDCKDKLVELINNISKLKDLAQSKSGIIRERYCIESNINTLNTLYNSI